MTPHKRSVEFDSKTDKNSTAQKMVRAVWILVALAFVSVILYVIPYYNRWYRVPVNLLGIILFLVSMVGVAFVLIPWYLYKKRFVRIVVSVAAVLFLLFLLGRSFTWRMQLTEYLIQDRYCLANVPVEKDLVLGGITNAGGGFFINDSHCLIVVCDEEFYYCDRPAELPSQQ